MDIELETISKYVKLGARIMVFAGAMVALAFAYLSIRAFIGDGPGGERDISLENISGPNDVLIGAYLETKANELTQPAGSDDTPMTFTIQPGETPAEIGKRLREADLISDAELFRRYVQYHRMDASIEAGEFTLRQTMTIPEIAQALQKGTRNEQIVTIQEGMRLEQIANAVANQTIIPADEFLALATTGWRNAGLDYGFLADLPSDATLEGFLFPETYRLPEEAAAFDLISRMLDTFDERVTLDMRSAAANRGLNVYQLVTLASIVEREAVLEEERPTIASVYHNRVRDGWFLGACPTVQYAMGAPGNWWPPFTLEATNFESPYNTYQNLGLPPGPICSPGLASIRSTAYPAETAYYYFLADCTKEDGSHLFAETQEEHNSNYAMCGGQAP